MARRVFSSISELGVHVREQTKQNARLLTKEMERALQKSVQENVYNTPEGKYRRTESLKNIKSATNYKDSNRTYARVWIEPKKGNSPYSLLGQEGIGVKPKDKVYTAWWIDGTTGKKSNGGFVKVSRKGVNQFKADNERNFTDQAIEEIRDYLKSNIAKLRSKGVIY